MATLAKDKSRIFSVNSTTNRVPIIADDIVYQGAAVGESSSTGTGRPLVSGDTFLGFATAKVDNAGGAASAKDITVYDKGHVWLSGVTGVTGQADLNATVYATDDDSFTLTASGASSIGKITDYSATLGVLVYFEASAVRSI
jgi:hypothetical protein